MNSDEVVRPELASRFAQTHSGLDGAQAVALLRDMIAESEADGTTVVSLIGGAASGKSTLSQRLVAALNEAGIAADSIGTDDFNKGDREWRWAHFEGDHAEPPIGKYDFDLLNRKVHQIKANSDPSRTIAVPTYNQATGLAVDAGEENYTHHIGPVSVLVVEGDFHPVEDPDMTVFLHVPDGARLQNRVNRDVVHRGGDPVKTTNSFNFRQQSQHLPYTVQAVRAADVVLDVTPAEGGWRYDVYQAKQES